MKKCGIITMIDNENCGNRLQNYALQEVLKQYNYDVYTIKNEKLLNWNDRYLYSLLRVIKKHIKEFGKNKPFREFNKKIKFTKNYITIKNCNSYKNKFDIYVVGSDQIWKPTRKRMSFIDVLGFAEPNRRIAYAPSFGLDSIDNKYYKLLKNELPKFRALSVREDAGKKIISDATNIDNVEVLVDPTMLIEKEKWLTIADESSFVQEKKFIFTYFLGDEDVEKLTKKFGNDYEIIDFYKNNFGPKEFLSLINNAELVLTDSFHACVFSILFNKKFYIFERKQKDCNNNMNSRIDTLCNKFSIDDRRIDSIDKINILDNLDYNLINKKLEHERKIAREYLKKNIM